MGTGKGKQPLPLRAILRLPGGRLKTSLLLWELQREARKERKTAMKPLDDAFLDAYRNAETSNERYAAEADYLNKAFDAIGAKLRQLPQSDLAALRSLYSRNARVSYLRYEQTGNEDYRLDGQIYTRVVNEVSNHLTNEDG